VSNQSDHDIVRDAASSRGDFLRALDLGVSDDCMIGMERAGILHRVAPAIYLGSQVERHALAEAAAWGLRHEGAVVGGLTAALHHQLTDAFARGVWLYTPRGTTVPRSRTANLQVVQISPRLVVPGDDKANGIITLTVHGAATRIADPDRTVIDLWRYPDRIPREYALVALGRRVRQDDFGVPEFARLARRLRAWSKLEPILQGAML
jgi:hypothetical protein